MLTDYQKVRIVELYASGESTLKIGRLLQLSPTTVNRQLHRCGVTLREPRETSTRCQVRNDNNDLGARMTIRPDKTTFQIATAVYIAEKIVAFLYESATVALDRKAAAAAKIAAMREARLSAERARLIQIADWYQDGASLKRIGLRLGVSNVTILRWMEQAGIPRRERFGGRRRMASG